MKILRRALALIKPGGVVVYSTCSFNPVENEAVVCACLVGARAELEANHKAKAAAATPGATHLSGGGSDAADSLLDEFEVIPAFSLCGAGLAPLGLAVRPGLTSWRVPRMSSPNTRAWGPKTSHHERYRDGGGGSSNTGGGNDMNDDGDGGLVAEEVAGHRAGGKESGEGTEPLLRSAVSWAPPLEEHLAALHAQDKSDAVAKARGGAEAMAAAAAKRLAHNPEGSKRSMYPSTGSYARLNAQLTNCARFLPGVQAGKQHDHDGGGFFVALIRRRDAVPGPTLATTDEVYSPASDGSAAAITTTTALPLALGPKGSSIHSASVDLAEELGVFFGFDAKGLFLFSPAYLSSTAFSSSSSNSKQTCAQLVMEGKRVVLASSGLVAFLRHRLSPDVAQQQQQQQEQLLSSHARNGGKATTKGGDGGGGAVPIHSCGLRVFLKLSENSFRASTTCR